MKTQDWVPTPSFCESLCRIIPSRYSDRSRVSSLKR